MVRHPSYTKEDRICGSIYVECFIFVVGVNTWWLVLYSYFSVDIVHVIMSHTFLRSFGLQLAG